MALTALVGKTALGVFTALLSPAVCPGSPARPGFIAPGSPFSFIQKTRLLKYHSKCAFVLFLPCIILCAQALLFPWVIPLGTFTALVSLT